MSTKIVTAIAILSANSVFAAYGCATTPDAGTGPTPDSSTVFPNDSGTDTNDSAAAARSNDGGPGTDDAATATCPGPVVNGSIPAYVAPTTTRGACTPNEIASYIASCLSADAGGSGACLTWLGSVSDGCWSCVMLTGTGAPAGGALVTTAIGPVLNLPGCIALIDPVNGPTCAPAFWSSYQCPFTACSSCRDQDYVDSCLASIPAPCQSYELLANQACAADLVDGGPANSKNGPCVDPSIFYNLFCGGGDAGPTDAG